MILFYIILQSIIFKRTHEKGNVLDLVLTSPCVSVTNLTIHSLSSFSDHFTITFDLFIVNNNVYGLSNSS